MSDKKDEKKGNTGTGSKTNPILGGIRRQDTFRPGELANLYNVSVKKVEALQKENKAILAKLAKYEKIEKELNEHKSEVESKASVVDKTIAELQAQKKQLEEDARKLSEAKKKAEEEAIKERKVAADAEEKRKAAEHKADEAKTVVTEEQKKRQEAERKRDEAKHESKAEEQKAKDAKAASDALNVRLQALQKEKEGLEKQKHDLQALVDATEEEKKKALHGAHAAADVVLDMQHLAPVPDEHKAKVAAHEEKRRVGWGEWAWDMATGWINADVEAIRGNKLSFDSSAIFAVSIASIIASVRTLDEYKNMGDVVKATGGSDSKTNAAQYLQTHQDFTYTYEYYRLLNSIKAGLSSILDISQGDSATVLFAAMCGHALATIVRSAIKFYQAERWKGLPDAFHALAFNGDEFSLYKLTDSLLPIAIIATAAKFGIDFNALPDYAKRTLGVSDDLLAKCDLEIDPSSQSCYITLLKAALGPLAALLLPAGGVVVGSIATLTIAHATTQLVMPIANILQGTINWCTGSCRQPEAQPLMEGKRNEGPRERKH